MARRELGSVRRLVVKVGTGLVTEPGAGADPKRIEAIVRELVSVRTDREIVLVTSGAIVAGMARLALSERPRSVR